MKNHAKKISEIVDAGEEGYCLIYSPSDTESQHDGHTWVAILKSHCDSIDMSLDHISFDSESDMFCAVSSIRNSLELLQDILEPLLKNNELIDVKKIESKYFDESDDDMTNEDLVKMLKDSGINLNYPRKFDFNFDSIKDKEVSNRFKADLLALGFEPKVTEIDGEIYFDVIMKIKPDAKRLNEIENKFTELSQRHGITYLGYGF